MGPVNKVTGKPDPQAGYAARMINHQLSVLSAFTRSRSTPTWDRW
jgi:hypothetical protein